MRAPRGTPREQTIASRVTYEGLDPNGPLAGFVLPTWALPVVRYNDRSRFKIREFNGPRYQGGMLQGGSVKRTLAAGPTGNVAISTHSVSDLDPGASATSGFQFRTNGELYEQDGAGFPVQFAGEWWSEEPDTGIGGSYEVRHLASGKTGTYNHLESATADTWITISSSRTWAVRNSSGGTSTTAATFELGDDGAESADDSATLTATANNLP